MKSNIKKHMGFHNYSKYLANLEAFHIVISFSMNIFSLKSELEIAIRVLFFYSKKFGKLNQNFSSNCAQYYLVKIRFYAQEQNFFFFSFYVSWTICSAKLNYYLPTTFLTFLRKSRYDCTSFKFDNSQWQISRNA